jgi:D-alanyl-D-alanine carboxypeptidase (penicillin-binding protein 5/6)
MRSLSPLGTSGFLLLAALFPLSPAQAGPAPSGLSVPSCDGAPCSPAGSPEPPDGPAEAWLLADMDSGEILAAKNPYAYHAPASTIKTLLALTVIDEVPLDSTVLASQADLAECSCVGVAPGHEYSVRQLLDGLLLVSGNDAANTLAEALGGFDAAVAKMNAKALEIGATDTRTGSPSGLDWPGMEMHTTPRDLAVIFREALNRPVFAEITAEPTALFPDGSGESEIHNQDELLSLYPGALGGKTGFTNAARKTFVGAAERDGRRLVVSMMHGLNTPGSPSYWDQAQALLDWGFALGPDQSVGQLSRARSIGRAGPARHSTTTADTHMARSAQKTPRARP